MSETIKENCYKKRMELSVVESDRHKPYISIEDLVESVIGNMNEVQLGCFLMRLFSWDNSINAFKAVLNGECGTDENDNKADVLRKVCLEHSSEAVKALLTNVLEEAAKEKQRCEDLKKHIEDMERQWPEPYKKYMPKKDYFFPKYIDATDRAQKMLEGAK